MATSVALTPDYSMLSILQLGFGSFSPFFVWPGLINLTPQLLRVRGDRETNENQRRHGAVRRPQRAKVDVEYHWNQIYNWNERSWYGLYIFSQSWAILAG